jgi:hypothetical protein
MPLSKVSDTWKRKIGQLRPKERISRVKTMAGLMAGIDASRSVQLGGVASKIPGRAWRNRVVRRLERLGANSPIRVREWYEPVSKPILAAQAEREYHRVVAGRKVGAWHPLLLVSLVYRHRTLPVAWLWVPQRRGHSSAARQLALLGYVRSLLPNEAKVLWVGDQEFGAIAVLKQLDQWCWHYVLRQRSNQLFRPDPNTPWQAFGDVINQAGWARWNTRNNMPIRPLCWRIGNPEKRNPGGWLPTGLPCALP